MNALFDGITFLNDLSSTSGGTLACEPAYPVTGTSHDAVWIVLRSEAAQERSGGEPALAALYSSILESRTFEEALVRNLAIKLGHPSLSADIHPGAQFGKGVFPDHATGFVAGETVVIEDNVSILHGVTLGGSGTEKGGRHPKVRTGVLIGSGAQIIGGIEIGAYSKIAAGSFVTETVPPKCIAVGVPARIIEGAGSNNPAHSMNQCLARDTYDAFN
jgi:serine O-acetyltransferase